MKTKAVRLHGEMDLRLDEFELPEMKEDEILARVISDSLCASTFKAAKQGNANAQKTLKQLGESWYGSRFKV